jgi:hypothetical protein
MRLFTLSLLVAGSVALAQSHSSPGVFHSGAVVPPNVGSQGPSSGGFHPRPSPRIPPSTPHPQHNRGTVVYYPVFYGGNYYGYDPSVSAPAPAYDAVPSDSPVVVMSQSYRPDMVRDYSDAPVPEPAMKVYDAASEQPLVYLIAMKDHTIFPTVAYWVEGDTLNYITTEGSPNRASLDLVDREFSRQLNDERHVEFKLPAVR